MTEQSSPVPSKAHAPSPLDIPARTVAPKPTPPRSAPAPGSSAQPGGAAQPGGSAQPGGAQQAAARPHYTAPVKVTGAQALVLALERIGVDVVFGIPGGAVLPAYDPLLDSK